MCVWSEQCFGRLELLVRCNSNSWIFAVFAWLWLMADVDLLWENSNVGWLADKPSEHIVLQQYFLLIATSVLILACCTMLFSLLEWLLFLLHRPVLSLQKGKGCVVYMRPHRKGCVVCGCLTSFKSCCEFCCGVAWTSTWQSSMARGRPGERREIQIRYSTNMYIYDTDILPG